MRTNKEGLHAQKSGAEFFCFFITSCSLVEQVEQSGAKLYIKSWLYSRGFTLKGVTSGGAHLRGLAPGQHSSEETLQRWQPVGDTRLTYQPEKESKTFRTDIQLHFSFLCNATKFLSVNLLSFITSVENINLLAWDKIKKRKTWSRAKNM